MLYLTVAILLASQVSALFEIRPVRHSTQCLFAKWSDGADFKPSGCSHFHYIGMNFVPTSDGFFRINYRSGPAYWLQAANTVGATLNSATSEPTTPSTYYWSIVPSTFRQGTYMVKANHASNLCWEYGTSTSTAVTMRTCANTELQSFTFNTSYGQSKWLTLATRGGLFAEVDQVDTSGSTLMGRSSSVVNNTREWISFQFTTATKASLIFASNLFCLTTDDTTATLSACLLNAVNQTFDVTETTDKGSFRLVTSTGRCLTGNGVSSAFTVAPCNFQNLNQLFYYRSNSDMTRLVRYRQLSSSLYLTASGHLSASTLSMTAKSPSAYQAFHRERQTYSGVTFNKTMQIHNGRTVTFGTSGAVATLTQNTADFPNQRMNFQNFSSTGTDFLIRDGSTSNLCLSVGTGGSVVSATCNAADSAQRFTKEEFDPTEAFPSSCVRAVQSGDWTSASTWSGSAVPPQDNTACIEIPIGLTVTLPASTFTVEALEVRVFGVLTCANSASVNVNFLVHLMTVSNGGEFHCGTESTPFPGAFTMTFIPNPAGPALSSLAPGLVVTFDSLLSLHGKQVTSWTKMVAQAPAGSSVIQVEDTTGWQVGDTVVVATTGFDWRESEVRTITGLCSGYVTLNQSLEYNKASTLESHLHPTLGRNLSIFITAEVGLLTRNIKFVGTNNAGHIIIMERSRGYVQYIEMASMGIKSTMGRYPIHWHDVGEVGQRTIGGVTIPRQYLRGTSIHRSSNRCMSIHCTNGLLMEKNVCYDFIGHGYILETGHEFNNDIFDNLAIGARSSDSEVLIVTDVLNGTTRGEQSGPSGFWWLNGPNNFVGNHAAGSEFAGFSLEPPVFWNLNQGAGCKTVNSLAPLSTAGGLGTFENNTAHSVYGTAFWLFQYSSPIVPVFKGLRAFRQWGWGAGHSHFDASCFLIYNGASFQPTILDEVVGAECHQTAYFFKAVVFRNSMSIARTGALKSQYANPAVLRVYNHPSWTDMQVTDVPRLNRTHFSQDYDGPYSFVNIHLQNWVPNYTETQLMRVGTGFWLSTKVTFQGLTVSASPDAPWTYYYNATGDRRLGRFGHGELLGSFSFYHDLDGSLIGTPDRLLVPFIDNLANNGRIPFDPYFISNCPYDATYLRFVCQNFQGSYFRFVYNGPTTNPYFRGEIAVTHPDNKVYLVSKASKSFDSNGFLIPFTPMVTDTSAFWRIQYANYSYFFLRGTPTNQRGGILLDVYDPKPNEYYNLEFLNWPCTASNVRVTRNQESTVTMTEAVQATSMSNLLANPTNAPAIWLLENGSLFVRVRGHTTWNSNTISGWPYEIFGGNVRFACDGVATFEQLML